MAFDWFKKKSKPQEPENKQPEPEPISAEPEIPLETAEEEAAPQAPAEPVAAEAVAPAASEPPSVAEAAAPPSPAPPKGLFARLKRGLAKTREILTTDIEDLFKGKTSIDDQMLEELEELLITSDIGVQTAMDLMKIITRKANKIGSPEALKEILKQEILKLLDSAVAPPPSTGEHKPHVIMVIGVNGVGKTTTIGKLAARKTGQGKRVLIVAADTFRAAATEQLAIWAERAGADLVRHKDNADPAAVAYDGIEASVARHMDTVFIDTAGRLHTKVNLMEELKKIQRTIGKRLPDAPHEILLVLDATTGQNAIAQAKMFHESIGITGLALTKLDGTAKGGIVVSICQQLKLPLHYVGVGESIEDLQPFDAVQFVNALF
ncbi:MAG: signal recognition particle-docking protein FtsY [Desulfatitalea sp.]|nr:signal recognition particle-docking protein FtsY [Desulfatitalea sp.]